VVTGSGEERERERATRSFNPLHLPLRTQSEHAHICSILLCVDIHFFSCKWTTDTNRLFVCLPFLSHAMILV
jgi:hypothetical protein